MRAAALCVALALSLVWGRPAAAQGAAADAEAHIFGSFSSRADHGVLADKVRLGPALRRELGADAGSQKVYDALLERISGRFFRVDAVRPGDAAQYGSLVGANLTDPLVTLEAGEVLILMQYASKERKVAFVEQVRGPASGAKPAPTPQVDAPQLPAKVAQPAPIDQVPLPAEPPRAPAASKPAPVVSKPAPVVAKPAPPVVPKVTQTPPAPVVVQKPPTPAPAPVAARPTVQAECVIKPVMSDDDLRACGAGR
jgi:hypothetical protein